MSHELDRADAPPSAWARLRDALGLERNIIVMLLALLALGAGEELWSRFAPKYLEMLGGGVWVVAAYGTLKDLLDAILPYPGGWLSDHLGRRRALAAFALSAAVGYVIYLIGPSWQWFLVGTCFAVAWNSLALPAIFAVIGDHLPAAKRGTGFSVQSLWKRVPIVIAPPIGGALIAAFGLAAGVRIGFAVSILLAVLAVVIIRHLYAEAAGPGVVRLRFGEVWRGLDRRLKRLLVADVLARWAEGIPKVFIVLYVLDVLRRAPTEFGWLVSLQMFVATVIYLPLARLADRMNRKPFVLTTFVLFALFPLVLVLVNGTIGLAVAFILAGLREVGEPARKALIVDLCPPAARGRSVGVYYLARGLTVFPASFAGGWLWAIDPSYPFYAAFAIGVVGVVAYGIWGADDGAIRSSE
ncbi:MAG TPA: MFS transporter [Gemmataceae bacterium]|jgi:MFS family permease|nr:MFS transporter [Gemmataceae bacterium]